MENTKKLYRSTRDKYLGGVCGGIARYFNVDPVIIRLIFFIAAVMGGGGIIAYIVLWAVLPEEPLYTIFDASDPEGGEEPAGSAASSGHVDPEPQKARPTGRSGGVPKSNLIAGLALILLGAAFLADNFIDFLKFSDLWPVVLIILGGVILLGSIKNSSSNTQDHEL